MRIQIFMFLLLIVLNATIDWYIFKRIILRYFKQKYIYITYWGINLLLLIAITTTTILIGTQNEKIPLNSLMWIFYFYLLIYVPKISYSIISLLDYPVLLWYKKRRITPFSAIGLCVALILFVLMGFGSLYERVNTTINSETIAFKQLPESFDGYRIVQLSDIHLGNYCENTDFIEKVVTETNSLNPDLIVFTGDLVNLRSNELNTYMPILSKLRAKDGVYSVLGNHDYGDYTHWNSESEKKKDLEELIRMQQDMGWHMLNNGSVTLKSGQDSILLIGVENWGEPPFPQYGNLQKAIEGKNLNSFSILLSHNPVHWDAEIIGKTNINLTLAGHTHAMQIKLECGKKRFSPSQWRYKRWSGLYQENDQYLYVNEGIGYVFLPMRIGATPEITLLELKKSL